MSITIYPPVGDVVGPASATNNHVAVFDGATGKLLKDGGVNGGGTVTSVSVTTANGVSGTVATATTTPAITLTLGAITPTTIVASGAISGSNLSGTNTGDQTTVSGNAGSATILQNARNIGGVSFNGSANINPGLVISGKAADYTTVLGDANTGILHNLADNNTRTFTIDGSLAYAVGTFFQFANQINVLSIAITTDTLVWANDGTTGTRTLTGYGLATALKIAAGIWVISGSTTLT